jgi:hypothetical protein
MKRIIQGMVRGLVSAAFAGSDLHAMARPGKSFWARRM